MNKRRRGKRAEKVRRDVQWVKQLQNARLEAQNELAREGRGSLQSV